MSRVHTQFIRLTNTAIALLLIAILVMGLVYVGAERVFLDRLNTQASGAIALHRENINGWLGRFRALPSIHSRHPALLDVLRNPDDATKIERLNILLERWTYATGAAETYVLDTQGQTVAASNWFDPDSFVGNNYAFRPYFIEAMEGRLGRFFALGTSSGERGYYYSYPVRMNNRVLGVVVVKAAVRSLEEELRLSPDEVFISDQAGVIVISGHPDLQLTVLDRLTPSDVARMTANRQFDVNTLSPTPMSNISRTVVDGFELVRGRADRSNRAEQEFLHITRPMATEGWTLHILTATRVAYTQSWVAVVISGLAVLVILLLTLSIYQRRRLLLNRLFLREREGRILEQRVAERTIDLQAEVQTRRLAEDELRQTQSDLVQAGKMAVLGQMSTALSHEFNQPLTAIRSYAENAIAFVEQSKTAQATENLARITRLTSRMAQLSRRLSNFARKPGEGLENIAIAPVFDEALALLEGRLTRAGITPHVEGTVQGVFVRAGAIRLQHVLMNLIGNALDAMEQTADPQITLRVVVNDMVRIEVEDTGPGMPQDIAGKIFDPFFTTKEVGRGVGLGLSISYNIVRDFDGRIYVDPDYTNGARFCVVLNRAEFEGEL